MRKPITIIICSMLTLVLLFSLSSCATPTPTMVAPTLTPKAVIEIPLLMRNSGNDSGMKMAEWTIEHFNAKYEGTYKLKVEWMPGVAEDFRAKLKVLNASNDLPAIVTDLLAEPAFGDLLITNNRLLDLKPYFDSDTTWSSVCVPESVAYVTKDGKMYTSPTVSMAFVGMFYNKELFAQAGVAKFPETWDEFWKACELLKASDIIPVSLVTQETGWCTFLLGTSSMATKEDGRAFMTQQYPTNFDAPVFKETMEIIKRLFTYSTSDAVGGNYALAANNFCSGKTAMIANGPWMIASLSDTQFAPEGFDKIVGYAPFPGSTMLSWLGLNYGLGVSVDHPKEVQEGAVEYIKFLSSPEYVRQDGILNGNFSTKIPLTAEDLAQLSLPMQEYAKAIAKVTNTLIVFQTRWDPIVQNEVIPAELPSLITGQITVDEFCAKMVEGAKKYAELNKK